MLNPINKSFIPVYRGAYNISYKGIMDSSDNGNSIPKSDNNINNSQSKTCLPQNQKASIFYINDFHGKAMNMERAVTASRMFDSFTPECPTDKLKFSSGDIMLGEAIPINRVAMKFLKYLGIMASAVGNHECDMKSKDFENEVKNMPAKLLACNIKNESDSTITKYIEKSYVQEVNGTKYGVIGTIPSDLITRIKYGKVFQDQNVIPANIDETIQCIQNEVDKFKKMGINKIILLSHSGYGYDIEIAKRTEGVDVILGGHSHTLIKDITDGVNLFYSTNGEPVVITQAGRDGKNFGILNLEFDQKGIIKKAQNNVGLTRDFKRNVIARKTFEEILGKPKIIGTIRTAPPILQNDLIEPNPLGYYGIDAVRELTGADIGLVNAANIRGSIEKGTIDTTGIEEVSPFKNKILKINYTEKEIVDALKFCAKSFVNGNNKPGIMYPSGLKYTVTRGGKILNITYIDKNGKESNIDVANPRTDKIYSVAINDYHSSGNDGLDMLNKYFEATARYNWDINYAIEQKIRNSDQPIDIVDDGRIQIVD